MVDLGSKHGVSQIFMLQQFSIVISHWSGLAVIGVTFLFTIIRFLILGLFFSCRILVVSTTQTRKSALQIMARIMMIGSLTESHPSPQVSMIALCEDIDMDDLGTSSESVLLHWQLVLVSAVAGASVIVVVVVVVGVGVEFVAAAVVVGKVVVVNTLGVSHLDPSKSPIH